MGTYKSFTSSDSPKGLCTLGSFVTFHDIRIPLYNATNCNAHVHTDILVPLLLGGPNRYKMFTCTPLYETFHFGIFPPPPLYSIWGAALLTDAIRAETSVFAEMIIGATNRFEVPTLSPSRHL